jgi:hypothetical protein
MDRAFFSSSVRDPAPAPVCGAGSFNLKLPFNEIGAKHGYFRVAGCTGSLPGRKPEGQPAPEAASFNCPS